MNAAGWAPSANSLIAHATIAGAGTPPMSSSSPMRNHSPCCQARTDFLNDSGRVTVCVVGVERRRVAVGVGERFRERPLGQPRRLVEHLSHGLAVEVTELAGGQRLLQVEHLEQVELQIAHVALVVAHALRLSLRTDRGTVADRRTRLGGPRLVLREAGAGSEVSGDAWNTVHRRYRTAGHHASAHRCSRSDPAGRRRRPERR